MQENQMTMPINKLRIKRFDNEFYVRDIHCL